MSDTISAVSELTTIVKGYVCLKWAKIVLPSIPAIPKIKSVIVAKSPLKRAICCTKGSMYEYAVKWAVMAKAVKT